ncbi:MAG TPA: nucleotide pyrophosphohydrolase [Aminobacterium sp.]|jgi:NTP pyrophosphatase (non-canonical NTP hydrolase)|uniref:nucleotide pyrophosphohydrolase n=1 Tax=Aminobacterium TaxID=81466 RepID=UPI0004670023|nr:MULTISPECIES: nucleotide pyrophosphohydrolase [Aminobacterium]HCA40467.1 nucleotide pyrophosphohydrolase [Aminobacterium sp.]
MDVEKIQKRLRFFTAERDWEQFHSPKNLVMALAGETGELVELFQWLSEEESYEIAKKEDKIFVEEEVADIAIYLLRICDKLSIDLEKAVNNKIEKNGIKYPVALSKGKATKYNRL